MKNMILSLLLICGAFNLYAEEITIIPKPVKLVEGKGEFVLSPKTKITYTKDLEKYATYLQEVIALSTGWELAIVEGKAKKGSIALGMDNELVKAKEGYQLDVNTKGISICGAENSGVFYGIQTLLQLFPAEIYNKVPQKDITWSAPAVFVEDAPSYPWRGMMLDVARYFYDKEFVKKYIDMMAMYKLNTLQFHMIDDSGWRLEIKKYPRLTDVGAWAGKEGSRIGGYYTQEDIKEIVAYAAVRHVDVVPEIAFPAHMLSAVVAYPWLSCTEKQHEVPGQHFISRDLLCMGKESSFQFLKDVFDETMALFPSKYIHIGGDEAVYTEWDKCPKCQAVKKEQGLTKTSELQGYLTDVVSEMMKKHDKTVVGWQELTQRGELKNKVVSVIWTKLGYAKEAMDKGHYTVLCPASHMYFDFPESRTSGEPKAATWMPPVSVEKCYSLKVGDYDQNNQTLGVQGAFWSDVFIHGTTLQEVEALDENRSENYAEYLTFPRLLALSEVGWSVEGERNFADFADRMQYHFAKLDNKACHYRVPEPVISEMKDVDGGAVFTLAQTVDNAEIRYTTDGRYPHSNSPLYTEPVKVDDKFNFKAITITNSDKKSLPVFIKEEFAAYKKFGTLTAKWKPSLIKGETYAPWKFECTGKIAGNGTYEITFIYTGGTHKLELDGIKLYKRNELIGEDNHKGETGGKHIKNKYTITVDSFEAGTPFFIEANVRGDLGNDSNGIVLIKKVK